MTQMLPESLIIVPIFKIYTDCPLLHVNLRESLPALSLIDAAFILPIGVWILKNMFDTGPREVREAALVDGASPWRAFRGITLPMILPALVAIGLLRLIMAFKVFDLVYALTNGGPGFDTTVGTFQIYRVALQQFDVGYAAAQTILFGVLVGLVTLPVVLLRDWAVKQWS